MQVNNVIQGKCNGYSARRLRNTCIRLHHEERDRSGTLLVTTIMVLLKHRDACARLHTLRLSTDINLTYKRDVKRDDQRSMVFYNMVGMCTDG